METWNWSRKLARTPSITTFVSHLSKLMPQAQKLTPKVLHLSWLVLEWLMPRPHHLIYHPNCLALHQMTLPWRRYWENVQTSTVMLLMLFKIQFKIWPQSHMTMLICMSWEPRIIQMLAVMHLEGTLDWLIHPSLHVERMVWSISAMWSWGWLIILVCDLYPLFNADLLANYFWFCFVLAFTSSAPSTDFPLWSQ